MAESTIRSQLEITREQMGWVMSAFFWTYAVFQIPSGWLSDRHGARLTLPLYAGLWSLATILFAAAGLFVIGAPTRDWLPADPAVRATMIVAWLITARLLAGAAQAGVFPCAAMIFSSWLPTTRRAAAAGFLGGAMQVGFVLGMFATGVLLAYLSWGWIFAWMAVPGIVWGILFYAWFRETPAEHPAVNSAERTLLEQTTGEHGGRDEPKLPTPWLRLAASPPMWCICGQQFFRAAGYIFYATWFATFLQEDRGVTVVASGVLGAVPLVAGIVGNPLGGIVADAILSRTGSHRLAKQGVGVVSMLGCAAFIFLAYGVRDATIAALIIGLGSFCGSLAGGISYSTTIDMGGRHVPTIFATMNMSGNIGAAVFPIAVPLLLSWTGENWNAVLLLFGGIYVAAAACWLFLNPHGTFAGQSLMGR